MFLCFHQVWLSVWHLVISQNFHLCDGIYIFRSVLYLKLLTTAEFPDQKLTTGKHTLSLSTMHLMTSQVFRSVSKHVISLKVHVWCPSYKKKISISVQAFYVAIILCFLLYFLWQFIDRHNISRIILLNNGVT